MRFGASLLCVSFLVYEVLFARERASFGNEAKVLMKPHLLPYGGGPAGRPLLYITRTHISHASHGPFPS